MIWEKTVRILCAIARKTMFLTIKGLHLHSRTLFVDSTYNHKVARYSFVDQHCRLCVDRLVCGQSYTKIQLHATQAAPPVFACGCFCIASLKYSNVYARRNEGGNSVLGFRSASFLAGFSIWTTHWGTRGCHTRSLLVFPSASPLPTVVGVRLAGTGGGSYFHGQLQRG